MPDDGTAMFFTAGEFRDAGFTTASSEIHERGEVNITYNKVNILVA